MKTSSLVRCLAVACLSIAFLAFFAIAEEPKTVSKITFTKNRVVVPDDGETTNDVALAGGILVKTNGVFTVKKGKERQLREGQSIASDGLLSSPDGSVVPVADHLALRGVQVLLVKDGDATPLSAEYTLPDAARVAPDGRITGRDGRLRRMLEGQVIKLDGEALQATDTVSLKDGKVVLFKDGGRVELRRGQIMAMSDGSKVNGDGYVLKADGTRLSLTEGEIIRIPGVLPAQR